MAEARSDLTGFHLLLAGGGSGGHVFPALAVGAEATRRGARVSFVGSPTGMEARLVRQHGVAFHGLPARPVVGRGLAGKMAAAGVLAGSTLRGTVLARRLAPDAVLATGGYAAVAPALGARLAGRPLVLLEPNARPGAANRMLSRFAAAACVAFPETGAHLSCPATVTGVPVREAFFVVPAELPVGPPRLLLLGGSQGAQQLNRLLPSALALAAPRLRELSVLHQCGEAHLEATRLAYAAQELAGLRVEVVPFIADVDRALAESHLVVSRAGAITLAELAAAGRASLLVPLALAEDHQRANAAAMERAGAARLLPGAEATAEGLAELLVLLLDNRVQLAGMGRAARSLARPRAAAEILDRIAEVAR